MLVHVIASVCLQQNQICEVAKYLKALFGHLCTSSVKAITLTFEDLAIVSSFSEMYILFGQISAHILNWADLRYLQRDYPPWIFQN